MKQVNPAMSCTKKRQPAFTLVELLVVIGVIAILISMLLPALNKARQQARFVQCGTNMRAIGQWAMQYAVDNNGYLPTSSVDGGGGFIYQPGTGTCGWSNISGNMTNGGWQNYLTGDRGLWTQKAGAPYSLYSVNSAGVPNQNNTVLFCPSAVGQFEPFYRTQLGSTYALNQYLGGQRNFGLYASGLPKDAALPKLRLLHADTYWFAEATVRSLPGGWDFQWGISSLGTTNLAQGFGPWTWANPGTVGVYGTLAFGHPQGQSNFLFGDGHVEPFSKADYTNQLLNYSSKNGRWLGRFY